MNKHICYHPDVRSTQWNQPRPKSVEMTPSCKCGKRAICIVCGWGTGAWPCDCEKRGQDG